LADGFARISDDFEILTGIYYSMFIPAVEVSGAALEKGVIKVLQLLN
jgi:hypothetical protein